MHYAAGCKGEATKHTLSRGLPVRKAAGWLSLSAWSRHE